MSSDNSLIFAHLGNLTIRSKEAPSIPDYHHRPSSSSLIARTKFCSRRWM